MKKKISVTNSQEKKKFLKKLPFYRSMLYRFTSFEIESTEDEIGEIITALNIKKRKKRIDYVFEKAVRKIDSYYQKKDFCQFIGNQCLAQRIQKLEKKDGCCRLCEHRTGSRCPTRNIACKLFYCSFIKEKEKLLSFEELNLLKVLTWGQQFILKSDYFSKEEDVKKDLYMGVGIAPFRIGYRLLKSGWKNNRKK